MRSFSIPTPEGFENRPHGKIYGSCQLTDAECQTIQTSLVDATSHQFIGTSLKCSICFEDLQSHLFPEDGNFQDIFYHTCRQSFGLNEIQQWCKTKKDPNCPTCRKPISEAEIFPRLEILWNHSITALSYIVPCLILYWSILSFLDITALHFLLLLSISILMAFLINKLFDLEAISPLELYVIFLLMLDMEFMGAAFLEFLPRY